METEVVVEILLLGLGPAPERTWAGIRVTGLDFLRHYNPAAINRGTLGNSYAPPVSEAEPRSARVGGANVFAVINLYATCLERPLLLAIIFGTISS
jgi:hypothetical protein